MEAFFLIFGVIGWALAAGASVAAYRYWCLVGHWRRRADRFRLALRRCDERLEICMEQHSRTAGGWENDPTIPDKKK
jgi:hypothetical protein